MKKNILTITFLFIAGLAFAQPVRTTITDDGVNVTVQTPVNIKVIPICDFHWVFVDGQLKMWIEGGNELIPGGRLGNFTINGATTQQAKLDALGAISAQCGQGGGGGTGGSSANYSIDTITQSSHGFSMPANGFIAVRKSGSNYVAANTADSTNLPQLYVVAVLDANTIVLQQSGKLVKASHGLTVGADYFLTDAGGVATTADSDGDAIDYAVRVATATDVNTIFLRDDWAATNKVFTVNDGSNSQAIKTGTTTLSGVGLRFDASTPGTLSVLYNFSGLTGSTSTNGNNKLVMWDSVAGAYRSIRRSEFLAGLSSSNIYNSNGSLTGNRSVTLTGYTLNFGGTGATNLFYMDVANGRASINRNSTTASQTGTFSVNGSMSLGTFLSPPTNGLAASGSVLAGSQAENARIFALQTTGNAKPGIGSYLAGSTSYTNTHFFGWNANSANNTITGIGFAVNDTTGAERYYGYYVRKYTQNLAFLSLMNNGSERITIGESGKGIGINKTTPSPNADAEVGGTQGLGIPVGTTAQRPSSPVTGTIRLNTDSGFIEYFNGTIWVSL